MRDAFPGIHIHFTMKRALACVSLVLALQLPLLCGCSDVAVVWRSAGGPGWSWRANGTGGGGGGGVVFLGVMQQDTVALLESLRYRNPTLAHQSDSAAYDFDGGSLRFSVLQSGVVAFGFYAVPWSNSATRTFVYAAVECDEGVRVDGDVVCCGSATASPPRCLLLPQRSCDGHAALRIEYPLDNETAASEYWSKPTLRLVLAHDSAPIAVDAGQSCPPAGVGGSVVVAARNAVVCGCAVVSTAVGALNALAFLVLWCWRACTAPVQ